MPREKAIMTYGLQSDRLKAAAMARLHKLSVSAWMLKLIRDQYAEVYGDADPEKLNVDRDQR